MKCSVLLKKSMMRALLMLHVLCSSVKPCEPKSRPVEQMFALRLAGQAQLLQAAVLPVVAERLVVQALQRLQAHTGELLQWTQNGQQGMSWPSCRPQPLSE